MSHLGLNCAAIFFLMMMCGVVSSCRGLPDNARPQLFRPAIDVVSSVIAYRPLRRDDFQAVVQPPYTEDDAHPLNAHTAVALRTCDGVVSRVYPDSSGEGGYIGEVQNLKFVALMLPQKSWWNPDLPPEMSAYVLQHEQVHFTLMEIAARELNRKVSYDGSLRGVRDDDADRLQRRLAARIDALLDASQKKISLRHAAFDMDTSRLHNPSLQQWWHEQLAKELDELSMWSTGKSCLFR